MRIRALLTTSAALAGVLAVCMLTALYTVTERARGDLEEQAEAQLVARHLANMLSLTSEFIVFGGERAALQWLWREQQLVEAIDRSSRRYASAPAEIVELRRQVEDLPALFEKLRQVASDSQDRLAPRRRELLLERLMSESQEVVESRHRWASAIAERQQRNQQVYTAMVLGAPALLLGLLLTLGALVARRVLAPLARLQDAAIAIRSGDLTARCASGATDELGDAARAVDAMAFELQRQTAAQRDSEQRLRLLADNLPALVVHLDTDERFTFVNAYIEQLTDFKPGELLGRTLREARGDAVYAQIAPHVACALSGEIVTFELTTTARSQPRHLQSTYVPDRDEAGEVRGFYVMTFDVTARKQAELRQAASERRLADITDNIPALIAYVDREHRYQFANANYGRWLGQQPAEILGQPVPSVVGQALYAHVRGNLDRALAGEHVQWNGAGRLLTGEAHLRAEYIPDIDAGGAVRGCYVLTVDISERRAAELRVERSEQRLLDLTNSLPAMIGYYDMAQRCQYANDTALMAQGIERSQLPGLSLRDSLGEAAYALHEPHVASVLRGQRARLEGSLPFAGRAAHFQAHLIPDRVEGGEQRGFYVMTFDITALKEAQQKQAKVERQLRAITDNLPVLISYIDDAGRYVFLNGTFESWFQMDPRQLLGRRVAEVMEPAHDEQQAAQLARALAGERLEFEIDTLILGQQKTLHSVYVPDIQPDGRVAGIYTLTHDVTALKDVERRLNELARVDTLTALPNRRRFDERLVEATARAMRSGEALALMFLDIDHFKAINDGLGHAAGDTVLKEFAARLKAAVRSTDMPARLAGDEFVVLLEGLHTREQADLIASKVVAAIGQQAFCVEGSTLQVTTSVGVAFCRHPHAQSGLLALADEALYEAKDAGRNTFRVSCLEPQLDVGLPLARVASMPRGYGLPAS